MKYEQFVQKMYECTKNNLADHEQVELQEILKNNGVVTVGLSIRNANENIAPIIYLEEYYERYLAGEAVEDLSACLLKTKRELTKPPLWNYGALLDFEKVKNQIVYRLVNLERNKELLKEVPHLPMLDFAIIFYVSIPAEAAENCSVLIKNGHMNIWKLPISVLYETAKRNTKNIYPWVFRPLSDYLEDYFDVLPYSPLWVLTNVMGINGATALLYPGMPKRIYEKLEQKYFLLPSSVHEFLVVPDDGEISADSLKKIVREVNETQIEAEEYLSDNIYHFDGKNITKM